MISVYVARCVLLVMSVLALLTATVLDGINMRLFVRPLLRLGERANGRVGRLPGPLTFMLERAWARRLYHLLFALVLLAGWGYLGTAAGAARWTAMASPATR